MKTLTFKTQVKAYHFQELDEVVQGNALRGAMARLCTEGSIFNFRKAMTPEGQKELAQDLTHTSDKIYNYWFTKDGELITMPERQYTATDEDGANFIFQ